MVGAKLVFRLAQKGRVIGVPALPHRDKDPILRLSAHYFHATDLMRKHILLLERKRVRYGKLSYNDEIDRVQYTRLWLACLHSVCDGFCKLNMRATLLHVRPREFLGEVLAADNLLSLIKENLSRLRVFRNSVFHLTDNPKDEVVFFEESRIDWAEQVHQQFDDFFSSYRISCEVVYLTSNRLSESSIRRDANHRKQARKRR